MTSNGWRFRGGRDAEKDHVYRYPYYGEEADEDEASMLKVKWRAKSEEWLAEREGRIIKPSTIPPQQLSLF